jgi:hypothetical protein
MVHFSRAKARHDGPRRSMPRSIATPPSGKQNSLRAAALSLILLLSLAAYMPALRGDDVATISGRATAGYNPSDAVRKTLTIAAKITVDHGFRYFRIMGAAGGADGTASVRPGVAVAIKLYGEGEIDPRSVGTWDAQNILMNGASIKDLRWRNLASP